MTIADEPWKYWLREQHMRRLWEDARRHDTAEARAVWRKIAKEHRREVKS